jgi:hypothetical protein
MSSIGSKKHVLDFAQVIRLACEAGAANTANLNALVAATLFLVEQGSAGGLQPSLSEQPPSPPTPPATPAGRRWSSFRDMGREVHTAEILKDVLAGDLRDLIGAKRLKSGVRRRIVEVLTLMGIHFAGIPDGETEEVEGYFPKDHRAVMWLWIERPKAIELVTAA